MKRIFIIEIVPNEFVAITKGAQAANNFCTHLIDSDVFDHAYSIVPSKLYVNGIQSTDKITYYHGNPNHSHFFKHLKMVWCNIKCSIDCRKAQNIWMYNICHANILCFLILKYIFRKNIYAILLDYTPDDNRFHLQHYYPLFLKSTKGLISLSQRINFRHKNIIYKAGVMSLDKIRRFYPTKFNEKLVFLFCGNMGNHTGFPLVIDVFSEMANCELYISGKNPSIDVDFSKYPNIHYLGYMEYDDFIKLYEKVDVCLSFRNPSYPENYYNFPSKIIEFFSQNKIVLSTLDYPELQGFKYICCKYDRDSVIDCINHLLSMPDEQLNKYRNNSEMLINNYSVESWKEAMVKLEENT